MKTSWLDKVRGFVRVFRWIVLVLIALVALALTAVWLRRDQVLDQIVAGINQKLKAPVQVASVEFSIDRFPEVGVVFKEVYIPDPSATTDTLLYAERVWATSDFRHWLRGRYPVNHLEMRSGLLALAIRKHTGPNYLLLRDSSATASSGSTELRSLRLKDMVVRYTDEVNPLDLELGTTELEIEGNLAEGEVEAEARWSRVRIQTPQLRFQDGRGSGQFVGTAQQASGTVSISAVRADWSYDLGADGSWMAKGQVYDIALLARQLGATLPKQLESIVGSADFEVAAGRRKGVEYFDFQAQSEEQRIQLADMPELSLDYAVAGRMRQGRMVFDFERIKVAGKGLDYSGTLQVEEGPRWNLSLDGDFSADLSEAKRYVPLESIRTAEGKASGHLSYRGGWGADMDPLAWNGTFQLEQAGFQTDALRIDRATGAIRVESGRLELNNLLCRVQGQEAFVNGSMEGFFSNPEDRKADLRVRTAELRIADAGSAGSSGGATGGGALGVALPEFPVRLSLEVDRFYYGKLKLQQLRIDLQADPNAIDIQRFHAEGMGQGTLDGKGRLERKASSYIWYCQGKGMGLDLSELFRQFDGFGQNQLTEKQLSGKADIDFETGFAMSDRFDIDLGSVTAQARIQFTQTRLKDFAPLQALSLFAQKEALNDVLIPKHTTHLRIADRRIDLEPAEIATSAFGLQLGGTHYFDQRIDYRAALKVEDLLTKGKRKNTELEDYIQEASTRPKPVLRFRIQGTMEQPLVSLDKEASADQLGKEWKQQFQPSKKDSTGTTKENPLQFEWGEDEK